MKRVPTSRTGTVARAKRIKAKRADACTWSCQFKFFDETGQRQSETVYGETEADARQLAHDTLALRRPEVALARAGLFVRTKPAQPTLSELADKAADEYLPTRQKPAQIVRTAELLARWWDEPLGKTPVDLIRRQDIRAVLARMRRIGKGPGTCNRALAALSSVLGAAVEWDWIDHNPCQGARLRQKEGQKVPRFLRADEARRLLAVVTDEPWRLMFAIAIYAGLRYSELGELRRRDLQLERGVIVVRDPKNGEEREVPIHPELRPYLPADGKPNDRVLVWLGRKGKRVVNRAKCAKISNPSGEDGALMRALRAAGIDRRLSIHDLRHTCATLLAAANVPVRTIQLLMGHKTLSVTQRYIHLAGAPDVQIGQMRLQPPPS